MGYVPQSKCRQWNGIMIKFYDLENSDLIFEDILPKGTIVPEVDDIVTFKLGKFYKVIKRHFDYTDTSRGELLIYVETVGI